MTSELFGQRLENLENLLETESQLDKPEGNKLYIQMKKLIEEELAALLEFGGHDRSTRSYQFLSRLVKAHSKLDAHHRAFFKKLAQGMSPFIENVAESLRLSTEADAAAADQSTSGSSTAQSWTVPIISFMGNISEYYAMHNKMPLLLEYNAGMKNFNAITGNHTYFMSEDIEDPPMVAIAESRKAPHHRVRLLLSGDSKEEKEIIDFEVENREYRQAVLGHLLDMGCSVIQSAEHKTSNPPSSSAPPRPAVIQQPLDASERDRVEDLEARFKERVEEDDRTFLHNRKLIEEAEELGQEIQSHGVLCEPVSESELQVIKDLEMEYPRYAQQLDKQQPGLEVSTSVAKRAGLSFSGD
ncbi:MAG: hypothetical protein Q9216_003950 [Gyalolechia sp. 2 TL-2023]